MSSGRCEEDGHEELETYVTGLAILREDKAIICIYGTCLAEEMVVQREEE